LPEWCEWASGEHRSGALDVRAEMSELRTRIEAFGLVLDGEPVLVCPICGEATGLEEHSPLPDAVEIVVYWIYCKGADCKLNYLVEGGPDRMAELLEMFGGEVSATGEGNA